MANGSATEAEASGGDARLMTLEEFLVGTPPGEFRSGLSAVAKYTGVLAGRGRYNLTLQPISLECDSPECGGVRVYEHQDDGPTLELGGDEFTYEAFVCRNCRKTWKRFALWSSLLETPSKHGRVTVAALKLGELPQFGSKTPDAVLELFGEDRNIFLKGRSSENRGLGIGAYAYYRRVVEAHKDRILDGILKVVRTLDPEAEKINQLEIAKKETQFGKAMDIAKPLLPDVLKIDGQNPLARLHTALSDGLHDRTDEECLAIATSVRVVLTDLTTRVAQALKQDTDVKKALGVLAGVGKASRR